MQRIDRSACKEIVLLEQHDPSSEKEATHALGKEAIRLWLEPNTLLLHKCVKHLDLHDFGKLETLQIQKILLTEEDGCPTEKRVNTLNFLHEVGKVEKISLFRCRQLKSLPNDLAKLENLKVLDLRDCTELMDQAKKDTERRNNTGKEAEGSGNSEKEKPGGTGNQEDSLPGISTEAQAHNRRADRSDEDKQTLRLPEDGKEDTCSILVKRRLDEIDLRGWDNASLVGMLLRWSTLDEEENRSVVGPVKPMHPKRLLMGGAADLALDVEATLTGVEHLDLSPLEGLCTTMKTFRIRCTTLQSVALSNCAGLTELPGLRELKALTTLDLDNCTGLTKPFELGSLTTLKKLNLSGCCKYAAHLLSDAPL